MVGSSSCAEPHSYSATVTQPPPSLTCTTSSDPSRDAVVSRSKERVVSARSLVSAVRTTPIGPSSVVRALRRTQYPEAHLPDETTWTLPFFGS